MGLPLKRSPKRKRGSRKRHGRGRRSSGRRSYRGSGGGSISVIQGRGDYTMDPNASFGTRYGGYLGARAGEFLGGMAQRAFGSITGLGDYSVNRNVFLGGNLPQIMNESGGGGTVIRFQEYLGDIVTSATAGAFNISAYNLNAADSYCFPWLSQIAANYEQYEFEGLLFQFRSTSADALNSTNTALGSVMLATQYDFLDIPFASKGQMLNYEFSSSCKPCENVMHMVECAPRATTINNLYTLSGALPVNADARLYHLGKFQIATTGFQGTNVNIGELHVTYQVRLLKPKLNVGLGGVIDTYVRILSNSASGVYTNALPLGTVAASTNNVTTLYDSMGITMTGTSISFLRSSVTQFYRIEIGWIGDASALGAIGTITGFGGVVSDSATGQYAEAGVGSIKHCTLFSFKTAGDNSIPSITFGAATLPASTAAASSVTVRINQVNPGSNAL